MARCPPANSYSHQVIIILWVPLRFVRRHVQTSTFLVIAAIIVNVPISTSSLRCRHTHNQSVCHPPGLSVVIDTLIKFVQTLFVTCRRRQSSTSSPLKVHLLICPSVPLSPLTGLPLWLNIFFRRLISLQFLVAAIDHLLLHCIFSSAFTLAFSDARRHRSTWLLNKARFRQ